MLKELTLKNRSYRRYNQGKRITEEQLVNLVELARICPSAANLQNLRYYIVHSQDHCELLFPHLKWAAYLRYWDGPEAGERPSAYIIILAPVNTTKFHHIDTGIVAQTMLLGASEQGFGGCMLASVDKPAIQEAFSLPPDLEISLVVAFGYPAETIVIEEVTDPDDIEYWRDDEGIHHVPKRNIRDLIIRG